MTHPARGAAPPRPSQPGTTLTLATPRAMTERLRAGEASLSELAEPSGFALPTILKHLKTLEHAGLVEHYKRGRERRCRLVPGPLEQADAWLAHYRAFWAGRFAGLGEHLAGRGG